jgi:hypothetical protein
MQSFSIQRPSKIYPNWKFWYTNITSGNPAISSLHSNSILNIPTWRSNSIWFLFFLNHLLLKLDRKGFLFECYRLLKINSVLKKLICCKQVFEWPSYNKAQAVGVLPFKNGTTFSIFWKSLTALYFFCNPSSAIQVTFDLRLHYRSFPSKADF